MTEYDRVQGAGAQVRGMEDVSFCSIIGIAGMLGLDRS